MDLYSKTMKTTLLLWVTAGFAWTAPAAYEIRPDDRAVLELTVEKTGLLGGKKHLFTFSRYQATLRFDPTAPETSTVELEIETASIFCHDTWLSAKDLRKVQDYAVKDMLAADRYPRITFRSTAIAKVDSSKYQVQGNLTIRDVSRPVIFTASLQAAGDSFPHIEGSARLLLTDFGLKPPTALLGAIGTKNEIVLRFVLTAKPQTASPEE